MKNHPYPEHIDRHARGLPQWLFVSINGLGLLIYLPVLFATLMSFDAPGSGGHWAHGLFVVGNLGLGPLCLVGLISKPKRYWGVFGYALMALGWMALILVCGGEFTCAG